MTSMSARAGFTLSLDCEGLWGMADQYAVVSAGAINDVALGDAYAFIRHTLDASGLRATAAFVSCFAAGAEAVRNQRVTLEQLASHAPTWFSQVLPVIRAGRMDGWDGARHYQALKQAGHEMAWHGATHLPLTQDTPTMAVDLEVQLAQTLGAELGQMPKTIVFPRNRVGHLSRLRSAGFTTYRASPPEGFAGRLGSLASEWRVFDNRVHDVPQLKDDWFVSPAGFFLNWPSGVRAMVPSGVTVARWKSLLHRAAAQGGYVHMWFHPHNLITAPAMKPTFKAIMQEVGHMVRAGDIVNLTMEEANAAFAHHQAGSAT